MSLQEYLLEEGYRSDRGFPDLLVLTKPNEYESNLPMRFTKTRSAVSAIYYEREAIDCS